MTKITFFLKCTSQNKNTTPLKWGKQKEIIAMAIDGRKTNQKSVGLIMILEVMQIHDVNKRETRSTLIDYINTECEKRTLRRDTAIVLNARGFSADEIPALKNIESLPRFWWKLLKKTKRAIELWLFCLYLALNKELSNIFQKN